MVLKRNKTDNRTLFIDASAECEKVTNNNKLREHHIKKILDAFVSRADTDHFARCVPYEEIANNEYNLSVSTYIQPEDTREVILQSSMPRLSRLWPENRYCGMRLRESSQKSRDNYEVE